MGVNAALCSFAGIPRRVSDWSWTLNPRRAENLPDYPGGEVFANPNTTPGATPKPANDNTPQTPTARQTGA